MIHDSEYCLPLDSYFPPLHSFFLSIYSVFSEFCEYLTKLPLYSPSSFKSKQLWFLLLPTLPISIPLILPSSVTDRFLSLYTEK